MSKSRSSTPRVPASPNSGHSRRSSRHVTSERPAHPSTSTRARLAVSSDPETRRLRSAPHRVTSHSSAMGKVAPRSASPERGDTHSSSSDSPSAMADTETGDSKDPAGEPSSPAKPEPVKKKRTRTLTTPHQSAVLHALLAQSRFPTTAQREEVGRTIGLSARKVQIWFQNQRQKARRPKNPNVTSSTPTSQAATSATSQPPLSYTPRTPAASFPQHSYVLSGPGVPGPDGSYAYIPPPGRSHDVSGTRPIRAPTASPRIRPYPLSLERPRSMSPPLLYRSHIPTMRSPRARELSRTLPPLIPPSHSYPEHEGASISRRGDSRSSLPSLHSVVETAHGDHSTPYISPTEPIFAHNPEGPSSRPFALQTPVRWESESYKTTFYLRPTSSWTDASTHHSTPPATATKDPVEQAEDRAPVEENQQGKSPASLRSGRYDPVRGIVVPFSAPSPSPAPDAHEDR